ncbi:MAG: hypothetical protein ACRCY6_02085 [Bacteroidales bacterium]
MLLDEICMNQELEKVLDTLNSKFERLVSLCERTRVQRDQLKIENTKLVEESTEQKRLLEELEEKQKKMLVTQAFVGSAQGHSDEAKEKISKIVREIDKCILLLNR